MGQGRRLARLVVAAACAVGITACAGTGGDDVTTDPAGRGASAGDGAATASATGSGPCPFTAARLATVTGRTLTVEDTTDDPGVRCRFVDHEDDSPLPVRVAATEAAAAHRLGELTEALVQANPTGLEPRPELGDGAFVHRFSTTAGDGSSEVQLGEVYLQQDDVVLVVSTAGAMAPDDRDRLVDALVQLLRAG